LATPTENLLTVIQADQAHYLGILHDDFMRLTDVVKKIKGGGSGGQKSAEGGGGGIISQIAGLGKQFAQIAGVASLVVGAFLAIPAALTAITYAAMPFVQALSPSSVEAFNRELEGLKATVGEGLLPIIAYATASVREWAGILLPTIRELKPIIDRLASAVSGFMAGAVRTAVATFALLLQAAEPLIAQFSDWLAILGQMLEVAAVVVTVLSTFDDVVSAITTLMQGPILNILSAFGIQVQDLQSIVGKAVIGLAMLAAMLLKFAGANETLNKFRAGLAKSIESRKAPEAGLTAAPKDAAITGVDSIAAKMNERAFVATSGAPTTRATDDLLTDMLKAVTDIANDDKLKDTIKTAIKEALPGGETVASVTKVVTTVTDSSASSSDRFRAGREEGGLLGGALAAGAGAGSDLYDAVKFW
jgi:hypothetical protein